MIALIDNIVGGGITITLYQDKDKELAKYQCGLIEGLFGVQVFILEAKSLAAMIQTHGNWFDKLEGK